MNLLVTGVIVLAVLLAVALAIPQLRGGPATSLTAATSQERASVEKPTSQASPGPRSDRAGRNDPLLVLWLALQGQRGSQGR
jgi:hypothetical protein